MPHFLDYTIVPRLDCEKHLVVLIGAIPQHVSD